MTGRPPGKNRQGESENYGGLAMYSVKGRCASAG